MTSSKPSESSTSDIRPTSPPVYTTSECSSSEKKPTATPQPGSSSQMPHLQPQQPVFYDAMGRPLYAHPTFIQDGQVFIAPEIPSAPPAPPFPPFPPTPPIPPTPSSDEPSLNLNISLKTLFQGIASFIRNASSEADAAKSRFGCGTSNSHSNYETTDLTIQTVDPDPANIDSIKLAYTLFSSSEVLNGQLGVDAQQSNDSLKITISPPSMPWGEKLRIKAILSLPASLTSGATSGISPSIKTVISHGNINVLAPSSSASIIPVFGDITLRTGGGDITVAGIAVHSAKIDSGAGDVTATLLASESARISVGAGKVNLNIDAYNPGHDTTRPIHGPTVTASNGAGDIHGSVMNYRSLSIETGASDVKANLSPSQGSKTSISTGAGNIELSIASGNEKSSYLGYIGTFQANSGIGSISVSGVNVVEDRREHDRFFCGQKTGHVGHYTPPNPSSMKASSGAGNVKLAFGQES
ncbi:hypothetical protein BASA83_000240 [Batrachochytrium salamandrivorans]|nr:hypothetical protein BASA83_000240 [Batrachochytrium salamandrivorans]